MKRIKELDERGKGMERNEMEKIIHELKDINPQDMGKVKAVVGELNAVEPQIAKWREEIKK